jgi:hypothetical protein
MAISIIYSVFAIHRASNRFKVFPVKLAVMVVDNYIQQSESNELITGRMQNMEAALYRQYSLVVEKKNARRPTKCGAK